MNYILKNSLFIVLVGSFLLNVLVLDLNTSSKQKHNIVQHGLWQNAGNILLELEQYQVSS